MPYRILVAVDGSEPANRAIGEAVRMAATTGDATLRIVHVFSELDGGSAAARKILDDATRLANTDIALTSGITCEGKLLETKGAAAPVWILNEAHQWPADLIVMGTHGRRGIRRLALGSDAEMVLRSAAVPVLLVRSELTRPVTGTVGYRKIIVPFDGSGASKRGLREAIRIAKATGTALRLIHVVNELVIEPEYLPLLRYDALLARLRERGNAVLAEATTITSEAGVACESVLIETMGEDAAQAIIRDASAQSADLIVMGTHGRRGLRRLALGSDAEIVLRYAPAPLLAVREMPDSQA